MITWARLALALAQLFCQFTTWLRETQLINQGEANAIAKVFKDQVEAIELANKVRREAHDALTRDASSVLHHDKYERRDP